MRTWIKAALTGALALAAAFSAMWALRSIDAGAQPEPAVAYEWSVGEDDAEYVLREYEGYVGIFNAGNSKDPVSVTDIEIGLLRDVDRAMLDGGIPVSDRDELLMLLEDLGS